MIVAISWQGNNDRQQHFDLMEKRYINPTIINYFISFKYSKCFL